MSTSIGKLTVFFEEPFWVGVFERIENGKLSVFKVTFGAEPKDYEIYEFVLKNYNGLRFSPAIETVIKEQTKNSKKLQREIHRSMSAKGIGTKSQQALQLQHEQCKQYRKAKSREEKVAEEKRLFELKRNQRIIAGNAQFTGIAAGRGVGFTTGLLLLREGLGMRETPIRPHSWH